MSTIFQPSLFADVQNRCYQAGVKYVPPLSVMCLESLAYLLVMLNFSSNFLVYCSVSEQFKAALSRVCQYFCGGSSGGSGPLPSAGAFLGGRPGLLRVRSKNSSADVCIDTGRGGRRSTGGGISPVSCSSRGSVSTSPMFPLCT